MKKKEKNSVMSTSKAEAISKSRKYRKKWKNVTAALGVMVALGTTFALSYPALTQQAETYCGYEEHVHGTSCYEGELTCSKPEHVHTMQCFSNPEADVESSDIWERSLKNVKQTGDLGRDVLAVAKSQLGCGESADNYKVQDDGTVKGYSRYGAWFGDSYGDWDAMFVSFCMHYAGADSALMPLEKDSRTLMEKLKQPGLDIFRTAHSGSADSENAGEQYVPVPGDLVFLEGSKSDSDGGESGSAGRAGIVAEVNYNEKTNEISEIKVIEGDSEDCVHYRTYDPAEDLIAGYGEMPKNLDGLKTIESAPASDGASAVITGRLPENAKAEIQAVELSEEELASRVGIAKAAVMKDYVAYDITITADGKEWQPDESVSVKISQNGISAEDGEHFGAAHIDGVTKEVEEVTGVIDSDGEISMSADGFSMYVFFTVDFHYGEITYSIGGMESILLKDLFTALGINADASSVTELTFSDESLVSAEQNEAGEWMLVSHLPFDTNETLTATFNDGSELVIAVTDASATITASYSNGTVTISASGNANAKNKDVYLQYAPNGSSYSNIGNSAKSGNNPYPFSISRELPGSLGNLAYSSASKIRVTVDGAQTGSQPTLSSLLDSIAKPAGQSQSFSTWLNSYSGNKSTLSDVLTAYAAYQNSGTGGGDDPAVPEGCSVTWDDETKTATLHVSGTTSQSTVKLVCTTEGSLGVITKDTDTPSGGRYLLEWELAPIGSGAIVEITDWFITGSNASGTHLDELTGLGPTYYDLLDMIEVDTSDFGYDSDNFTDWLNNEFTVKTSEYGDQKHPEAVTPDENQMAALMDAYHYYHTGTSPLVKPDVESKDEYTAETTLVTPNAPNLDYTNLSGLSTGTNSKKIDWLGEDENGQKVEEMEDFYRLYLEAQVDPKPIDILLVVDQSGSMGLKQDGNETNDPTASRQADLLDFLDGTLQNYDPATGTETRASDGFIRSFLDGTNNRMAILTFGTDSSTNTEAYTKSLTDSSGTYDVEVPARYIREWTDTTFTTGLKLTDPEGATNYAAALAAANEIWEEVPADENNSRQRIMIFLSDGEPTVGYADGEMHTGFENPDNVIGTGGVEPGDIYAKFFNYVTAAKSDVGISASSNQKRRGYFYDTTRYSLADDQGRPVNTARWASAKANTQTFPVMTDMTTATIEVPGVTYPFGSFTNGGADFRAWLPDMYNSGTTSVSSVRTRIWIRGGTIGGENVDSHLSAMNTYDLFELTKSAYADFKSQKDESDNLKNDDITTFTIGFGAGLDDSDTNIYKGSRIKKNAVLTYMSGEKNFAHCTSSAQLKKTFEDITQIKNIVMTDKLSSNVAPAEDPQLYVAVKRGNGSWEDLYVDGEPTSLADTLLDTSKTEFDLSTGKLKVVFKPDFILTEKVELKADFVVKTNEDARREYRANDCSYGGIEGDPLTDYDTAHPTSSELPGLYSNDSGSSALEWDGCGSNKLAFPKPVVQLANPPTDSASPSDEQKPGPIASPIIHKQIDYLGNNDGTENTDNPDTSLDNSGAGSLKDVYRLYLDLKDSINPVNLLLVIDRSNSMYNNKDMLKDPNGDPEDPNNQQTRMEALEDFLNGKKEDCSDGFIQQFLSLNDGNQIAAVTFGTDSGADHVNMGSGENAYILNDYELDWKKAAEKSSIGKMKLAKYTDYGATNYTAAYKVAGEMLEDLKDNHSPVEGSKTYVLFLSDGVPTLTYTDGKMHNGMNEAALDGAKVFGTGNDNSNIVYPGIISGVLNTMPLYEILGPVSLSDYLRGNIRTNLDHSGVEYEGSMVLSDKTFSQYQSTDKTIGGYPVGYRFLDLEPDFSKFGLSLNSTTEVFEISNKDVFDEIKDYGKITQEENYNNLRALVKKAYSFPDEPYNLIELTEDSFDDFMDTYSDFMGTSSNTADDLNVIGLGFSGDINKKYRDMNGELWFASDVLSYMGANGGEGGGYLYAETAQQLAEEVNRLFLVKNPSITDILSDDVDINDVTDLIVYRKLNLNDSTETPEILYGWDSASETYKVLTPGANILNGVSLGPVYDNDGQLVEKAQLTVDFKDDYELDPIYTYSVSFNIKVNEDTKANFTGTYPDKGEKGTDYGDNNTSTDADGFFSNKEAALVWGADHTKPDGLMYYQKPVVQVPDKTTVMLRKIDSKTKIYPAQLAGAEFDLYLACESGTTGAAAVPGTSGKYGIKKNSSAIVSSSTQDTTIEDLETGSYYLVETKVPNGFESPDKPFEFEITGSGAVESDDDNIVVDTSNGMLIKVVNKSGYELPHSGGMGTLPFTLGGLALIFAAGSYAFVFRRRRIGGRD